MAEEADKCPSCGTHSYEQDEWEARVVTCRNCMRVQLQVADHQERDYPQKPGQSVVLRRRND